MIRNQKAWLITAALAVFLIPALLHPTLGGGWLWDLANGVGFAAIVCVLVLSLETGRGLGAVKRHERIAWFCLILVLLHAGIFLVSDSVVIEYLKLSAPMYMLVGIGATLLLLALAVSSQPSIRRRLWAGHASFKQIHWWLAMSMLGLAVYHVAGSAFYLRAFWQQALFVVAMIALPVLMRGVANGARVNVDLTWLSLFAAVGALSFTVIRNV